MAYSDPQLLHLDSMLTNVSGGFDNPDAFVASRLFPTVRVNKQSDKYYVYDRDMWGRVTDDIRAPAGMTNELPPMTLSRDSYFTEEHALKDLVPNEEISNADGPLDPLADATERVTNTILVGREKAMVDLATATANYASGFSTTLSGTSQWSDYANSDPVGDIKTGRNKIHDSIFRDPNTVIMGYQVAQKLEDHTKLIDRIKYTVSGSVTTDDLLAKLFGVTNLVRAGAGKLTSGYGASETFGYMWGKDVVLAYVPERPALRTPAYGYEFVEPYSGGDLMPTERWYDQDRKATAVRVSRKYDIKHIIVDSSGDSNGPGYLIKNAVA